MSENECTISAQKSTLTLKKLKFIDICCKCDFDVGKVVDKLVYCARQNNLVISLLATERGILGKQLSYLKNVYTTAKRRGGAAFANFCAKAQEECVRVKLTYVSEQCHADSDNINETQSDGKRGIDASGGGLESECKRLRAENAQLKLDVYKAELRAKRRDEGRLSKETYSRRHQRRIKARLSATAANYGIAPAALSPPPAVSPAADVSRVTAVLDGSNISLRKYSQIAALTPTLPRKHQIRAHRQRYVMWISWQEVRTVTEQTKL